MNTDPQKSCQPCGCDEGANWVCERHTKEAEFANLVTLQRLKATTMPRQEQEHVEQKGRVQLATSTPTTKLPVDSAERKTYPIATGVLDYFPDAIAAVAHVSFVGNQQHNPGQPMHWAREKSTDQDDTLMRHFLERGKLDVDGQRHSAKMVWRALAILQLEIEAEGK